MNVASEILSDITVFTKYARYLPELMRRETWEEICERNKQMHIKSYPMLKDEINEVYENYVKTKKVLPSMRSMQFAGKPIEIAPNRVYNCAFMPVNSLDSFSEAMFLLLGGTGVGYSVQYHHIDELPNIRKPSDRTRRHLIADSIEGWADSVKVLLESYTGIRSSTPVFDYSDIREKGEILVTSGGKAPGPNPLRECLVKIETILSEKDNDSKLSTIEAHDIMCHIADAVLAGGIRRAALICLFSADDNEMIACKSGNWWENNPQRGRANNSAVLLRSRITKSFFRDLWKRIELSGSGEPGIYLSHDKDWGTNPCCEIALRPYQFCNLTEINASNVLNQNDLENRAIAASFIGTLQAGYTDFHYLREIWQKTTEKDALLGVSMTGIASNAVENLDIESASIKAKLENERVAKIIGINSAARVTCIKPAGTTSLVLGTSSGIHAWHDYYYIRRMRLGKNEAIYNYLALNHPELVEDEYFNPTTQAVVQIPQIAPNNAIIRTESCFDLLERIKRYSIRWVSRGHNTGMNTHNVSATVSIKQDEWDAVGEWMWMNRHYYNGLSVLPYDGGTYIQAPFETITREKYIELLDSLKSVDLTNVVETQDNTDLTGELACAGGQCEI